ncbi:hypothetical protein scyTo_0024485 [Scyliorhinus torazame]|uniref:Collagen IV NC1 domain-containing protein n=1 Tax=Scyliorhinus torazame TaxID=75743 RepID=A0A401QE14_SCYTO|nr:hypothetical protein [Scyliorhinus torazame]
MGSILGQCGAPGDAGGGYPGDDGNQGTPGSKGYQGRPGLPGVDVRGPKGRRGFPGDFGPDGVPGIPGIPGLPGTPGDCVDEQQILLIDGTIFHSGIGWIMLRVCRLLLGLKLIIVILTEILGVGMKDCFPWLLNQ